MGEEKKLTRYPSIDRPWLKYYSEEAINASLPERTIYETLIESNKEFPNDIAIRYFSRRISYSALIENIEQCANALSAIGIKPGDIVTIALPSIPEALYLVYGLNKLGAVANMIHPLAGKEEILYYLNEVNSHIAFIFDKTYEIIKDSINQTALKKAVVITAADSFPIGLRMIYTLKAGRLDLRSDAFLSWRQFLYMGKGHTCKSYKKDCRSVAVISHTGGTTGEPKGCMLSDYNFISEVVQITTTIHYERQETFLAVLPPFVNYSLVHSMIGVFNAGLITVLVPKYEPLKLAEYIKKFNVMHINSIPAYCEALLQIGDIDKYRFPDFGYLFYGGEAMSTETEMRINEVMGKCGFRHKLQKGLGMTELTGAATKTTDEANELGSVGIPMPKMNCKIVDVDTTNELRYGEEGEVCLSGPTLMIGYFQKEKETEEIIKTHTDGLRWIHTGDLGYINEDGVLFLTGRIKRIMMTRGIDGNPTKMFPDRIEKAVCSHPAVEVCGVTGIPDEERINIPIAFVTLKNGMQYTDMLKEEIYNSCRSLLPDYQLPERIEYLKNLPRTERGKIDYRKLEEMAKGLYDDNN